MKRGFTLIEMLIVIVVIVLLMTAVIAVGAQVRANAQRRATVVTLKTLDGLMRDYLAKGNPEPTVPQLAASPNKWWYGPNGPLPTWPLDAPNYRLSVGGGEDFARTNPASDLFNWVVALKSDPEIARKLDLLDVRNDKHAQRMLNPDNPDVHQIVVDSYGTNIRYVPSTTTKDGYFMSAGPDGKWSMAVSNAAAATPTTPLYGTGSTPSKRADELYSTDPQ